MIDFRSRQSGAVIIEAAIVTAILTLIFLFTLGLGRALRNHLIAIDVASLGGEVAYRDCGFRFTDQEINECLTNLSNTLQSYGTTVLQRQVEVVSTRFEGADNSPREVFSTATASPPTLGTKKYNQALVVSDSHLLDFFNVDNRLIVIEVFVTGGNSLRVAYEDSIN